MPFDQHRALRILERFGYGSFEVVMNYNYHSAQAFYSSSQDFVKAKGMYKEELETEFKVKIDN